MATHHQVSYRPHIREHTTPWGKHEKPGIRKYPEVCFLFQVKEIHQLRSNEFGEEVVTVSGEERPTEVLSTYFADFWDEDRLKERLRHKLWPLWEDLIPWDEKILIQKEISSYISNDFKSSVEQSDIVGLQEIQFDIEIEVQKIRFVSHDEVASVQTESMEEEQPPQLRLGASRASIDGLKRERFEEGGSKSSSAAVIKDCRVCMEEFLAEETIIKMPCSKSHIFHPDCILTWLVHRNTCPLCRFELPTDDD